MEIPDYKADVCVAFAQGNMGRAIMLATSEHFNEIKEEAVHLLREINDMDVDALEAAVKRVVSYKMNITDYLDVISVWYRDVLIYKATRMWIRSYFLISSDLSRTGQARALTRESRIFWTELKRQRPD